jgi:tRNA nucleotidyltransferase (CCA-adding enzyme)
LQQDLARRDFTMNAMARRLDDPRLIDPHNGQADIGARIIRAVGNARERINEDALRLVRAVRFSITKKMRLDADLEALLRDEDSLRRLGSVSRERIAQELRQMFEFDTLHTLRVFAAFPLLATACFEKPCIPLHPVLLKI